MHDDGVGEPFAASPEPLDQRIRPGAEVAGDRVGCCAELIRDCVALGADRLDGLHPGRLTRLTISSEKESTAPRVAAEASASRLAME